MSSMTANLGLTLPAGSDWADVSVLNGNFEKIDASVGKKADVGEDGKIPAEQLPEMNYDQAGTAASAVSAHNTDPQAHPAMRAMMLIASVQVKYNMGGEE